jgi:hypothetical protein
MKYNPQCPSPSFSTNKYEIFPKKIDETLIIQNGKMCNKAIEMGCA